MARDGVGGCVGGGCGGLSLIGLLVGVGLTFWLGSIAMSGGFGGHDKKSDERSAVSEILATSTTVKPTATITATPATGLADGATVIVSSSSFPAGTKVTVSTCLGRATLATGKASLCDDTTVVTGTADANGHLNAAYALHRAAPVDLVVAVPTVASTAVALVLAGELGVPVLSLVGRDDPADDEERADRSLLAEVARESWTLGTGADDPAADVVAAWTSEAARLLGEVAP